MASGIVHCSFALPAIDMAAARIAKLLEERLHGFDNFRENRCCAIVIKIDTACGLNTREGVPDRHQSDTGIKTASLDLS